MYLRASACAAFLVMSGGMAVEAATTHTFDLSKPNDYTAPGTNSFSLDSVVGDTTLTGTFTGGFVTGYTVGGDGTVAGTFSNDVDLERHNNGAGVCRGDSAPVPSATTSFYPCGSTEPHTVDGATPNTQDYVQMGFSTGSSEAEVRLTELTFGWIGRFEVGNYTYGPLQAGPDSDPATDAFELIVDSMGDGAIGSGDREIYASQPSAAVVQSVDAVPSRTVSFSNISALSDVDLTQAIFGVKAGSGGSWKLLTATVEYDPSGPPSGDDPSDDPPIGGDPPIVPLPAAGWLLFGAFGCLAWVARRRRN